MSSSATSATAAASCRGPRLVERGFELLDAGGHRRRATVDRPRHPREHLAHRVDLWWPHGGRISEVHPLTPRPNRGEQGVGPIGHQHDDRAGGRLFDALQQRVPDDGIHPVRVAQDHHLALAFDRRLVDLRDHTWQRRVTAGGLARTWRADLVGQRVAGGGRLELDDVRMGPARHQT